MAFTGFFFGWGKGGCGIICYLFLGYGYTLEKSAADSCHQETAQLALQRRLGMKLLKGGTEQETMFVL